MNKRRKARIRELDAQHRMEEERLLELNRQRIKSMVAGFARTDRKFQQAKNFVFTVSDRVPESLPAKYDGAPVDRQRPKLQKEVLDHLEQRNKEAAAVLNTLKNRVAPVYNKGGYQYLGDLDLADVKAGKTRRRS